MVDIKSDKKDQSFYIIQWGRIYPTKFLAENGIESKTSCAYTPEQNGVAEFKE